MVVCFRFAHSVRCNFFIIMSMPDIVGNINLPSESGCWDADRSQCIGCVDVYEPKFHEVWVLGEDGVTPKVHLTERVDVGAGIFDDFETQNLTENGYRVPMFVKKSMNGIFYFLGIPAPLRTNGPPWINNIMVPSPTCGVDGSVKNLNWLSQPGGHYGGVSFLWYGAVSDRPIYVPRSL